jgi:hypothetical protein
MKYPNHLMVVTDLPRDTGGALGGLRRALVASFNYCRKYPVKMAILKETIEFVHKRIRAWESVDAPVKEKKDV